MKLLSRPLLSKTTAREISIKFFEGSVVIKNDSDSDYYLMDNFFRLFDGARQQAEERRLTMMCVGGARARSSWKTWRFKAPSQVATRSSRRWTVRPHHTPPVSTMQQPVNLHDRNQLTLLLHI